jgi:hypothetical protein
MSGREAEMARLCGVVAAATLMVLAMIALAQQPAGAKRDRTPRPPEADGIAVKGVPTPASGTWGVVASAAAGGGWFRDTDSDGEARLATQNTGVNGYGNVSGGYFQDSVDSGAARVGWDDVGIGAWGSEGGGAFVTTSGDSSAWAAYNRESGTDIMGWDNPGEYGVYASGLAAGGYFEDTMDASCAYLARGERGIDALGDEYGGVFSNTGTGAGAAILGLELRGLEARGPGGGGYFEDTESSGAYAEVATATYKIYGNGSVDFVQNHPEDPESVVVYAALEGDEVATFTRGTARIVGDEVRVPLGETFRWVTNPDVGLTAHLTPRGRPVALAVTELSTEEMTVRAADGSADGVVFDYLVIGLRIGFEETTAVQEKRRESPIPSMKDHLDRVARRAELGRFTARSRWAQLREAAGMEGSPDLSRARALRDAIQGARRAEPEGRPVAEARSGRSGGAPEMTVQGEGRTVRSRADVSRPAASGTVSSMGPEHRVLRARSFRPSDGELAGTLEVSEAVEPGEVLVLDPDRPGMLRRSSSSSDPTVVGVVAASPGVLLGPDPAGEERALAAVAFSGVVSCKVDAGYGPVYPGDLLVSSPTPGHAMRGSVPSPGTVVGKALEELTAGAGTIRILVMPQ